MVGLVFLLMFGGLVASLLGIFLGRWRWSSLPVVLAISSLWFGGISLFEVAQPSGVIAVKDEYRLVAFTDRPSYAGNVFGGFFLGTGFVSGRYGEEWFYVYYLETDKGVILQRRDAMQNTFIHERNSTPTLVVTKTVSNKLHWWQVAGGRTKDEVYDFYIPQGSIFREYNMNLR